MSQNSAILKLGRGPQTEDELHLLIKAMWGVDLPRVQVCPDHVSPFHAVAHAYFSKEPGYAVWYASRGSGKSLALAVLGLCRTFFDDVNCSILGGSMAQSHNVAAHMKTILGYRNAPVYALKGGSIDKGVTITQISLATGSWLRPIPASQTTVRGLHPPLVLLDEIDEMEWPIYEAATGQAMEQINSRGEPIQEYMVASSTWQRPAGTMTQVINRARKSGLPVFTWCWKEVLEPHGWMSERFINQKRQTVTAEMFHTEYELNEPSGDSRAFDLTKLEQAFVPYDDPIDYDQNGEDDQTWTWEAPDPNGQYAVGADWAKEKDKTVIVCARIDCYPRRLVYLRRVNKQPYPAMMKSFDDVIRRYRATGQHDKTGLGNVVNDFLDTAGDPDVTGFNFANKQKRSQMLLRYVNAVENGDYILPRAMGVTMPEQFLKEFHIGHRATTTGDVFGQNKEAYLGKGHLPDDVAAMGLLHRAAGHLTPDMRMEELARDPKGRKVTEQFEIKPYGDNVAEIQGEVTVGDWENEGWADQTPSADWVDLSI